MMVSVQIQLVGIARPLCFRLEGGAQGLVLLGAYRVVQLRCVAG